LKAPLDVLQESPGEVFRAAQFQTVDVKGKFLVIEVIH
jgi:hypothetical protein